MQFDYYECDDKTEAIRTPKKQECDSNILKHNLALSELIVR